MAILVLSPGDPSAGVKQPASRTRRVTESRGCSAHATVSGLHEGWRDRVGRMRANFLRAQKLRDHLGAMSRSTAYSSTILFVANFPANTGYAWDFIEGLYGGVATRLAPKG